MLKLISYFPNSFLAVARRHAISVGLDTNQALYLQQLCTRLCTCVVLCTLALLGYLCSPLHTAIHISSLCDFWHCHPYILVHFWKMFFILV